MNLLGCLLFGIVLSVVSRWWLPNPRPSVVSASLGGAFGACVPVLMLLVTGMIREGSLRYYACVLLGALAGIGLASITKR
jgi:hypothetical protein